MAHHPAGYVFDPADPRAPTDEQWARMTPDERAAVVAGLPSELDLDFFPLPDGDRHFKARTHAVEALGDFFASIGRRVYVSTGLCVYYPGERVIAPDLVIVAGADPQDREHWVISHEGRGIDLAVDIHVTAERREALRPNLERYARLGIPQYLVFDAALGKLDGHRLAPTGCGGERAYEREAPHGGGRHAADTVGLDLAPEGPLLRFYFGTALLLDRAERLARMEAALAHLRAASAKLGA